jgi:hypothetical protein
MKAIYEIVAGIELQLGDMIRVSPSGGPDGEVGEHVGDVYRHRPDLKVFRRIPATDDPRVLRRALEIASGDIIFGSPEDWVKGYIKQARQELESEGGEG